MSGWSGGWSKPEASTGGGGGGLSSLSFTATHTSIAWDAPAYDGTGLVASSVNIGAASSDRVVICFLNVWSNAVTSGIPVLVEMRTAGAGSWSGSIPMFSVGTQGVDNYNQLMTFMYYRNVPASLVAGSSIDVRATTLYTPHIEMTFGVLNGSAQAAPYSVFGMGYGAGLTADPKSVGTVTVPSRGLVLSNAVIDYNFDDTALNTTWTNATRITQKKLDFGVGSGGYWSACAYGTSGSPSFTTGAAKHTSMIVAAFAP